MDPGTATVVAAAIGFAGKVLGMVVDSFKTGSCNVSGELAENPAIRLGVIDSILSITTDNFGRMLTVLRAQVIEEDIFNSLNDLNSEIRVFHNVINESFNSRDIQKSLVLMSLKGLEQKLELCIGKLDRHGATDMLRCCSMIAGAAIVSAYAYLGEDVTSRRSRLQQITDEARRELIGDNAMNARYNVVVLGLVGVGKSSFINYLYGSDVMETGIGRSITKCFKSVDININGLPLTVFDSRGLEVGMKDAEQWMRELDAELVNRGTDKPVEDWFHTVLYCNNGVRFQDFEIEIINKLLLKQYQVSIVVTRHDERNDKDDKVLWKYFDEIFSGKLVAMSVCSVVKEKRGDKPSELYGKKLVEDQIYRDFWRSVSKRLPERCISVINAEIARWKEAQKKLVGTAVLRNDDLIKTYSVLEANTNDFCQKLGGERGLIKVLINSEIQRTIAVYGLFSEKMKYPPMALKDIEKFDLSIPFASYSRKSYWDVLVDDVFDFDFMFRAGIPDWFGYVVRGVQQAHATIKDKKPDIERHIDEAADRFTQRVAKIKPKIEELLEQMEPRQERLQV
jgi:GTPase SAR1 family protein